MKLHDLPNARFYRTVLWALLLCAVIVAAAAGLGRAALNFEAAVTEKPDLAIYVLLPDDKISNIELLREEEGRREYLATTPEGAILVDLRFNEETGHWYVHYKERLHD